MFSPSQICLLHCVWLWQTLCRGIVRRQTNVAEHNPVVCMNTSSTWGTTGGCPLPQFAGLDPNVRHSRNHRKQYQNNQKTKLFWSIPWQYYHLCHWMWTYLIVWCYISSLYIYMLIFPHSKCFLLYKMSLFFYKMSLGFHFCFFYFIHRPGGGC